MHRAIPNPLAADVLRKPHGNLWAGVHKLIKMHIPSNAHKAEAGTVMEELWKALTQRILHNCTYR